MNKPHILIIDDERITRENLSHLLGREGYETTAVGSGTEGLALLELEEYDVVLTDLMMSEMDGMELLKRGKELHPATEFIIVTGYATVDTAVQAIQNGAYSYQEKPLNLDKLKIQIRRALEKRIMAVEIDSLHKSLASQKDRLPLIGQSPAMAALKKRIRQVADTECNVLIQGETGTGKELVARSIHKLSPRSEKRFMAINCGTFTDDLMDNELFGHEKEAFTGAGSRKKGMLEAADEGVIFFDEISELGLAMQVKLLRVLQERSFLRVGGVREVPIDIQIIAATNKDLKDMVKQGAFREDLYYRLNVVRLTVPPLRERLDDLPLFLAHFIEKHASAGHRIETVTPEVLEILHRHDFPGNVRELENLVLRALTLGKGGVFDTSCLPRDLRCRHTDCPAPDEAMPTLAVMERRYLAKVLAAAEGNKTRAAAILGIDRVSLWRKIKKYGL